MKSVAQIKYLFLSVLLGLAFNASAVELPNTELTGSDGKQHHLKDFIGNGKWTTVVVWGPKCPACIEEMPVIQGLYDDIKTSKINVLGLVVDFPSFSYAKLKQVQQFEEDYFITFPNLLVSSDIYYELGIGPLRGTPTIVLVNPQGKVSAVQLGGVPRETIEKYIAEEDAKAAAKEKASEVFKKDKEASQLSKN